MSKTVAGRFARRIFTLPALVICLTIAAAPARASSYQISGTVHYYSYEVVPDTSVHFFKWNGGTWAYHGFTAADGCGNYTYDTGGPGDFEGVVEGWHAIKPGYCPAIGVWYFRNIYGSGTVGVSDSSPSAYLNIYATDF